MKNKLQALIHKAKQGQAYKREKIVLALTEEMIALMEHQGINKSALAERMETSKPYITKIMSGTANFTLDSMIQIADALNSELSVHLTAKNCETQWIDIISKSSTTLVKNSQPSPDQWQADEILESPELLQQT